MHDFNYLVRVHCMTYNHASFIEDAMNGFCMQETTFPFVCTIVDDASTDGEQEVIKKYLENHFSLNDDKVVRNEETNDYYLTFAQHNSNRNCYFAVVLLKYNHYRKKAKSPYIEEWTNNSKYIAMCEGDDYWTVSDKLQRQVDFLESHNDYSMCFHGANIIVDSGRFGESRLHQFDNLETREYTAEELAKKWIIPTQSMVYRATIKAPKDSRFIVGDLILRNQCAKEGKVYCFQEKMSVYRLNAGGATAKPFPFEGSMHHTEAIIEHFPNVKHIYISTLKRHLKGVIKHQPFKALFFLIRNPHFLKYLFK